MAKHALQLGTATFVRKVTDWRSDARLYRVDPPITYDNWGGGAPKTTDHVIVSAVLAYSGPETYIFPAMADGEAINMGELDGSQRGDVSHEEALEAAGYEVA